MGFASQSTDRRLSAPSTSWLCWDMVEGEIMKTKHCGGCDQTKPVDEFAHNSRAKDGRQYHCKTCLNAYSVVRKKAIKEGTWNS